MGKIESFQQLDAWREAHRLVIMVYKATERFPDTERFGLVTQMRRAAVSIPANIAEGFKRRSVRDKIHFYNIAEGSLEELKYYCILSRDLGYLSSKDDLLAQMEMVGKILNGLIASTERRRLPP
ncbi:MAG: four helix bundle protein [Anaerolineae bacterium]|nr:four helix bundle protein [Anaerolineae bacterium]MDW7992737.1 four helix bundle protein [Anaerolineae bacterium]